MLQPRDLLREPLLHFGVLAALLFALHAVVSPGTPADAEEIVVDRTRVEALVAHFERVWQRPPTPEELEGLVDAFVREEILYREGLALQLDRDDPIVRRRVGQKMAFLADAQVNPDASEAELQAWLDAHPDAYRLEPRTTLRQVFFDRERWGDRLGDAVAAAREALARDSDAAPGDASLLPAALDTAADSEIARVFGREFAEALSGLPTGGWHGPVASAYGVHLVEIRTREPGRMPSLAEVRDAVERDLLQARADDAAGAFHRSLRRRYTVRVEAGAERGAAGESAVVGSR